MKFTKVILAILAIWGSIVIFLGLFNLQIYFPFNVAVAEPIPYHRWQSVRFATFSALIYFIIQYLIGGKPSSALSFLASYFKFYILFLSILMWQADVKPNEWWMLAFFVLVTVFLHLELRANSRERHW